MGMSELPVRLTLVVPSDVELPADLFSGKEYDEGWRFATEAEALAFADQAIATHPGVVVDYLCERGWATELDTDNGRV